MSPRVNFSVLRYIQLQRWAPRRPRTIVWWLIPLLWIAFALFSALRCHAAGSLAYEYWSFVPGSAYTLTLDIDRNWQVRWWHLIGIDQEAADAGFTAQVNFSSVDVAHPLGPTIGYLGYLSLRERSYRPHDGALLGIRSSLVRAGRFSLVYDVAAIASDLPGYTFTDGLRWQATDSVWAQLGYRKIYFNDPSHTLGPHEYLNWEGWNVQVGGTW